MNLLFFAGFVCFSVIGSVAAKKLTVPAALTGGLLATAIYAGVGWTGIALLSTFFLLGTGTTSWKKNRKHDFALAEETKSGRTVGQVLANGGAGGLLGVLASLFPQHAGIFLLMMAGAFSSATADTVSSELGSVYGRKFYDVLTFKYGVRGADGVISLEGLLFGMAGSAAISVIYAIGLNWSRDVFFILMAGTVGNLTDSVLGATLERKGVIKNNAVNFLNTVVAALTVMIF